MAADRTSGGFGGKLRDARERRGISLRQIANTTKISVAALEALERNDVSRLPGGIFSRAFVRSYATEVGLDPDATIQEFIAQFPNDSITAGHPATNHVEDHVSVENDRRMAGTFLWLIGLSLPIAAAVLHFATSGRGIEPQAPPAATITTPGPEASPGAAPPGGVRRRAGSASCGCAAARHDVNAAAGRHDVRAVASRRGAGTGTGRSVVHAAGGAGRK